MLNYIIRRLFYAIPILIGVNLITFTLFFVVNTPDDMARMQLGIKRVTPEAIARWKQERGYDKPLMFNNAEQGLAKLTRTVFFEKSVAMFAFRFGRADDGRDIAHEIKKRMMPSLSIALPVFVLGLGVYIVFALTMVFFRATYVDFWGVVLCVALMSISSLFYIIGGQFLQQIVLVNTHRRLPQFLTRRAVKAIDIAHLAGGEHQLARLPIDLGCR